MGTTVFVFIVIILVVLICLKIKGIRLKISILTGIGISILSFFAFIAILFSTEITKLSVLLGIFDLTIITFLILWNLLESKKVYLLLVVPVMCVGAGIGILAYQDFVRSIPTVDEQNIYTYRYEPFDKDNSLAKLDKESSLKLFENLPVLDGATALYPVYASFAQAVYDENEYKNTKSLVLCNKTDGAYDKLLEGKVDIIFCAEPSDFQIKQFNDINIKLVPIGKEAFVFFVNKNNNIDNLSVDDIKGIYSGKIKNWKKLGGANQSIKAFQRPKNSGSQTILEKVMGNAPIMNPRRENVPQNMGGIINQVAVYRNFSNAIGYSFLYFSTEMVKNDKIKLLSISGIYPSKETIQNGNYPFSNSFYAIFIDNNEKNENVELFINWILSSQGQTLISKTGYIPILEQGE